MKALVTWLNIKSEKESPWKTLFPLRCISFVRIERRKSLYVLTLLLIFIWYVVIELMNDALLQKHF